MLKYLFLILISQNLWAANFRGDLYEMGSDRKTKLFTFERTESNAGPDVSYASSYKDLEGNVVVHEILQFKGGEPSSYELDQKQMGAKGKVEWRDGKMLATYSHDGKVEKTEKPNHRNLIITPLITTYLRKNWSTLEKGEKLKAELYVLDRGSTYNFEYTKFKEETVDGVKQVTIRMKPGNFLVAQLVDPLYFSFSPDGEKLLRVEGRTLPKKKVDSKWKDVNAEAVYTY
jgi:hypothetical protein